MTTLLFFFFSFSVIWLPQNHQWATKEETHSYDANHYTLPCSTWRSPGATWRGWGPKPNRAHQRDLNPEPCYSKLTRYSTVPFSPLLFHYWTLEIYPLFKIEFTSRESSSIILLVCLKMLVSTIALKIAL